jgi:anti-repressor protein
MTAVVPFSRDGFNVRAVEIDGEAWFVGKDIASALGYSNPQKAVRDHCRSPRPAGVNDSFTPSLDPQTVLVSEPDLMRLIVSSKLPEAEKFERWVFEEVLPEIRRTGSYRGQAAVAALPDFTDPVAAARAWADECEAKRAAQLQLEAAAPKVVFADSILNADGTTTVADVARTFKISVQKMRRALKIKKVILANNAPAAAYVAKGYFVEATHSFETSRGTQIGHSARVTGKGIEFLRRFAIRHADLLGLLPNGGAQNASLFDAPGKQA